MADQPTDKQRAEARIVGKHLDPSFSAGIGSVRDETRGQDAMPSVDHDAKDSSLKLLGGDVHRDLYKLDARAKLHHRSATFSHPPSASIPSEGPAGPFAELGPGVFRRQFLMRQQRRFTSLTRPASAATNNFIEFLNLYGQFAGEDLAETDDELASDDESSVSGSAARVETESERRPLLGRRKSSKAIKRGEASTLKTFFLLLKSFIGTGVLFLPKAFSDGGILFSSLALVGVSLISCVAFHLLLQCRKQYGGGYGEIGEAVGGPRLRYAILISIAISQIGFVCAGMVFVAENVAAGLATITHSDSSPLSVTSLLALQLAVLVPLALIRNIAKLGSSALLADVCILLGLCYIYSYDIASLTSAGVPKSVVLFNGHDFPLTLGTLCYSFEGVGLLLPIQSSMAQPQKFTKVLYWVMLIITVLFTSVGALCYATFGSETQTEIISNFPQTSKLVNAVQFLYSLAVLVGTPVQLFPAVRILEGALFGRLSGKTNATTKWKKNIFRVACVLLCSVIAVLGANDLQKFVALIGSFACIPLLYIYPPYLHFRSGLASSKISKSGDLLLMSLGLVALIFTTAITILRWTES